jgi:hypothetical protein
VVLYVIVLRKKIFFKSVCNCKNMNHNRNVGERAATRTVNSARSEHVHSDIHSRVHRRLSDIQKLYLIALK